MRKTLIFAVMLGMCLASKAQITIEEPEFVGTYYHVTSDSTFAVLPKENGTIKKHENKVSKWSKIAKGVSNVAGAAGLIGIGTSGSASGIMAGARVATTASGVSSAASSVNALAGAYGMDIVFKGKSSAYKASVGDADMRFIIKADKNDTNPIDLYRIVRFNTTKKERRVQWLELSPSLLGTKEASQKGYVAFAGTKFGEQSYLLTVSTSELTKGEYGIFCQSVESALAIPIATFGIE